jgi:hypothetical protein
MRLIKSAMQEHDQTIIGCSLLIEYDGLASEQRVIIVPIEGCNSYTIRKLKECHSPLHDLTSEANVSLLRPMFLGSILTGSNAILDEGTLRTLSVRKIIRMMITGTMLDGSVVKIDIDPNDSNLRDDLNQVLGL